MVSVLTDTVDDSAIGVSENIGLDVLRRSLNRAYKFHVIFLCQYHLGGFAPPPPPPPHTKVHSYATVFLAFVLFLEEWPNETASVPPTRYTKSPPLIFFSYMCTNEKLLHVCHHPCSM